MEKCTFQSCIKKNIERNTLLQIYLQDKTFVDIHQEQAIDDKEVIKLRNQVFVGPGKAEGRGEREVGLRLRRLPIQNSQRK